MTKDKSVIFLSYASPDLDEVSRCYDFLTNKGLDVWLDKRALKGGQNWDFEIKKALQNSAIIVAFISKNSVDRRGYVQREIKIALQHAEKMLVDDVFIIPAMLDEDVEMPAQLRDRHFIKSNDSNFKESLFESISDQLERVGVQTERLQGRSDIHWTTVQISDAWDGLPGYETSFQLLKFHSPTYQNASEITDIIKGWLVENAMDSRTVKFAQDSQHFDFGQERFLRTNSRDASCSEPRVKNKVLTVPYVIYTYGAGAAHPNQEYKTFAFTLDPLTQIDTLEVIFDDRDAALSVIRDFCRDKLRLVNVDESDEVDEVDEVYRLSPDWIDSGTENWNCFHAFVFNEDGIEIIFPPYQVAAYAFGPQFVEIGYHLVAEYMLRHYRFALGIAYLSGTHNYTK